MRDYRNEIKQSKGQTLVETAFILGLLLLLVLGIFEFGRAMYSKNTLTQAAREGARTAIVTPSMLPHSNLNCTSTDPVPTSVCRWLSSGVDKNNIAINIAVADQAGNSKTTQAVSGDSVTVTVIWNNYKWIVIPRFATTTVFPSSLQGQTSMRYE